ncbi:hypothetical protein H6P81_006896 [Aristolochia fimbriata]|uniref:Retrovirus-related Pol polyprotein from transposon TNT 1-94-like beta-barrel domain-containing protein n=1 Tax=Aristolochia fimbriata TaxID=158543 RepID=A0AAV7F2G5_ARIFI|nr:hypothetical protein H6P81_006896 [Aristolochia fimbriata]
MDPKFECDKDTLLFQSYIDKVKLVQFLMALREDYESVCSSMLHRSPLPSVESALSELLSEENWLFTWGPLGSSICDTETVFVSAPRRSFSSSAPMSGQSCDMSLVQCNYYKDFDHIKFTSPKLKKSPLTTAALHRTAASTSPAATLCVEPQSSSTLTALDVQDMITKALFGLGQGTSSALALSAHSGKSLWIIDSGASNHMSSDLSLFVSTSSSASASFSPICTDDGSQLSVSHVGSICTPSSIHLSDVLYAPQLSLNLISVGQLCDLGFQVLFTSSGCQDAGSLPATPLSPEPSLGPTPVPPLDLSSSSSSAPPLAVDPSSKYPTRVKTIVGGYVDRYKARLVAKGYTQEYGDDISGISDLKAYLSSCFEMKDLGPLRYFLGLEFRPFNGEVLADPTLYRWLVGEFMAAPRSVHYAAVVRIFRYVKGTLFQGLFMSSAPPPPLTLLAYSDADWARDITDRRSTTSYSVFLGYSPISWCSQKQTIVSRSSTEAEYRALDDTTS